MAINITKKTSTVNTTYCTGRELKYIVIHYTAGTTSKAGTAAGTASWFAQSAAQSSADFIVDDETIVQLNPDIENRYCWHCGGEKYNNKGGSLYGIARNANSIGIEICSTNDTGKVTEANDSHWSYTDQVLAKALELVKYLMEKYAIDADHVIRHYDCTGKPCPGIIGWNEDSGDVSQWKAFKESLTGENTAKTETGNTTDETASVDNTESAKTAVSASMTNADCPFLVRVSIDDLNIRKGAGTNTAKTGEYTGKGIFTILQVRSGKGSDAGWGKLKSGTGWIALDHCTRV